MALDAESPQLENTLSPERKSIFTRYRVLGPPLSHLLRVILEMQITM